MRITRQTIFLTDLTLPVSIGIHDFEREAPQRIVINMEVELEVPDESTPLGDDVANVLDYDIVRERTTAVATSRHFNLQESLCREIVAALRDAKGIARVRISTQKPDVYPDCAAVGYSMECVFRTD